MSIRLKQYEIDAIKRYFVDTFTGEDHLWIFGSRVVPEQRGGDIDLYVETTLDAKSAYNTKLKFINMVCDAIGDQRIDVVLNLVKTGQQLPIYQIAKSQGIKLI